MSNQPRERKPWQWQPGQSGNPKGRPRSKVAFGEIVRRHADPMELFQILMAMVRGQGHRRVMSRADDGTTVWTWQEAQEPTMKERQGAMKILLEYGFVKAPVQVEVAGGTGTSMVDFGRLSPGQLDEYGKLLALASGQDAEQLVPGAEEPTSKALSFAELEAAAKRMPPEED